MHNLNNLHKREKTMKCTNCGHKMTKHIKDLHYTESGLDNVILMGLTIYKCSCGEKMPQIPDISGLHRKIGVAIAKSKKALNGPEVRFLRKELGLKANELAELLGVYKVSVSRWETGKEQIGVANDRLVRVLYLRKIEEECKKMADLSSIFKNIIRKTQKSIQESHKPIQIKMPIQEHGAQCISL